MRSETATVALLFGLVSLAGCFGGDGDPSAAQDCRTVPVDLYVTNTLSGTHPVYRLNALDDDGEPVMMEVVAMGFQLGSGNEDEDPASGSGLQVPNPEIRVKECDTVVLTVTNLNDLPHTFHLHGGLQGWEDDGVPFVSQLPIHNGDTRTYVFEDLKAGTYWYHCHVDVAHHIDLGMYGAFIVEEREPAHEADGEFVLMLDEWDNCHVHGGIDPAAGLTARELGAYPVGDADCQGRQFQDYYAQGGLTRGGTDPLCDLEDLPPEIRDQLGCEHGDPPPGREPRHWYYTDFPPYTPVYNTFTINGKAFPDTQPIYFEDGKTYRIRLINVGEEWHSMHLHGHNFLITHRDGYEDPQPQRADTISIGPGERFDVLIEADNPGFWTFHDHVGLNVANDYQAPGGMFTIVAYTGAFAQSVGFDPAGVETAIDVMDFTRAYHEQGHDHGAVPKADTQPKVTRNSQGQVVLTY